VKIEPTDVAPNEKAVLPEEIIKALDLKMVWRNIGKMHELKMPIYESTNGNIMAAYKDGEQVPVAVLPKFHIARYDMLHDEPTRWDCIQKEVWCILMEVDNEQGTHSIGSMFSDAAIRDIEALKKHLCSLAKRLQAKIAVNG
jgi:hypothetical protein